MVTLTLNPVRIANGMALRRRAAIVLWLLGVALMLGLHFAHLQADFPNHSQWNDWAKYTDEGWYANAAIRHQLTGDWYLPGDFNPAVAMPIWPVLAGLLFRATGVSLTALRALTGVIFLIDLELAYLLLRRSERRSVALLGVTLGATSAFLSAFSRIAILEPMLIGWFLLALWLAGHAAEAKGVRRRILFSAALGGVLCLLILTKTTGICLLPAIVWMLWPAPKPWQLESRWHPFAGSAAIAFATALALWAVYYTRLVLPHYTEDYRYLFTANVWPRPDGLRGWLWNTWCTLHGVLWLGRLLPGVAVGVCVLTVHPLRALWRNPLFPASLLSIAGVLFFVWSHNNTQPRYYMVLAPAVIFIAILGGSALLRDVRWRMAGWASFALLGATCLTGAWRIMLTAAHPEYTYLSAAQSMARYIDQHPEANRMVLSISSDQLRLMTGIPAICDDFGTDALTIRIARYKPGWFASWNEVDTGTLEDIHTAYRLVRVASFAALDDPNRDRLILYRMFPLPGPDVGVDVDSQP